MYRQAKGPSGFTNFLGGPSFVRTDLCMELSLYPAEQLVRNVVFAPTTF
jgi:hypothetical protein